MAQTLEKNFLQKIRDMPADEVEVQHVPKTKGKKGRAPKNAASAITRKRTIESQPIQSVNTVTSSNDEVSLQPDSFNVDHQVVESVMATTADSIAPIARITDSLSQVHFCVSCITF